MQSVRRQLKIGNAVLAINYVTKNIELVTKRGTDKEIWKHAMKRRVETAEFDYMNNVTKPLTQEDIIKGKTYNNNQKSKKNKIKSK